MTLPFPRFVVRQTFLEFESSTNTEQEDAHHVPKRGRFISEDLQLKAQPVSLDNDERCTKCYGTGKGEFFGYGCFACNGTGQKQDQLEEQIGSYRIVHDGRTLVTSNAGLQDYTEIAVLSKDTIVNVVEVVMMPRDKRIRARIENPAGWISLKSTDNGYCWAMKEVAEGTDAAPSITCPVIFQSSTLRMRDHLSSLECDTSPALRDWTGELSQSEFFYLDGEPALSLLTQLVQDHERTTIQLQRLPSKCNRELLMDTLNDAGFAGLYNFVLVPMDFKRLISIGYALVNFSTHDSAQQALRYFGGFCKWRMQLTEHCQDVESCSADWSEYCQGLDVLVERYQNNPVMHQSVPEICRPVILSAGVVLPFPEPTKRLRRPRYRRNLIESKGKATRKKVAPSAVETEPDPT